VRKPSIAPGQKFNFIERILRDQPSPKRQFHHSPENSEITIDRRRAGSCFQTGLLECLHSICGDLRKAEQYRKIPKAPARRTRTRVLCFYARWFRGIAETIPLGQEITKALWSRPVCLSRSSRTRAAGLLVFIRDQSHSSPPVLIRSSIISNLGSTHPVYSSHASSCAFRTARMNSRIGLDPNVVSEPRSWSPSVVLFLCLRFKGMTHFVLLCRTLEA
jgi:hypothetical protein